MSSTLPLDFPSLQAEAQRLTVEFLGLDPTGKEAARAGSTAAPAVRAFARLLADLDRSESRDRWARILAAKLGLPVGLTAPSFVFFEAFLSSTPGMEDCSTPAAWILEAGGKQIQFVADEAETSNERHISGLPLDPARGIEAFRLALHAAFGVAP